MPKNKENTLEPDATTVADDHASKTEEVSPEQLEDKTADRLAEMFEGKSPEKNTTDTEAESKTAEDSTPDSDKKTVEEESTDAEDKSTLESEAKADEQTTEEKKTATDEEADKGSEEIPQLPDAYYQAAIHRGISKEDIKLFYESNPEQCVRAYGGIFEAVKRSGADFAAQGRKHKELLEREAELANAPQNVEESEFVGVDIDALEKTEIDPDALAIIRAQNDQAEQMFKDVQALKAAPVQTQQDTSGANSQEVALINQQIDGFFTSDATKPYAEFYGVIPKGAVDWANLSPGQQANRWGVITMMDDILLGAEMNNREMSIDDAMQVAHLNVSESQRTKVIREELRTSITKRSKSLSLESASTSKEESTAKKTGDDLVEATRERLSKVFN